MTKKRMQMSEKPVYSLHVASAIVSPLSQSPFRLDSLTEGPARFFLSTLFYESLCSIVADYITVACVYGLH